METVANWQQDVEASFKRQDFMKLLGASIVKLEPGVVAIELRHQDELTQQHNLFHAGVSASIADSAGGYAAYSLFPSNSSVLTVSFNINLIRPAKGERLEAEATLSFSHHNRIRADPLRHWAADSHVHDRETRFCTLIRSITARVIPYKA